MFITFEGPEGCGKSTHAEQLKRFLKEKGYSVLLTREPGSTLMGEQIRGILLNKASMIDAAAEVYLFAADRVEHVSKIILPALQEGKIVISDRFTDSTFAYQVGGRGLPEDMVRYINMVSSKGLLPDLTLLLDVSPQMGLQRAKQKGKADRFESEGGEFHLRVRKAYLEIARSDPQRVKVINTENISIKEAQEIIQETVNAKL